jgi:hypothetical protein
MANRYAVVAGNWSDPATWDGGTLPEPGDVVRPNNFIVNIDQDVNVLTLTNSSAAPAVSNGYFRISSLSGTRTITASILASPARTFEVGNVTGEIIINGNIQGGTSSNASGFTVPSGGTVNITVNGDIYGSTGSGTHGMVISAGYTGTLTVNGNILGGTSTGSGLVNAGTGLITINGNVQTNGVSSGGGISNSGNGNINIMGSVIPGSGTGTVVSSTAASGNIYIQGDVSASNGAFGVTSSGTSSMVKIGGNLSNAENGRSAAYVYFLLLANGRQTTWRMKNDVLPPPNGEDVILTNVPSQSPEPRHIRRGVSYGAGASLTGTLDVPPPESVAAGVPVDNTVGTAALNISDVAAVTGTQIAAAVSA